MLSTPSVSKFCRPGNAEECAEVLCHARVSDNRVA
jgi:hypothetical protein